MIVVRDYCETHNAIVQNEHAGGPIPENWSGIPMYLRSYTVDA